MLQAVRNFLDDESGVSTVEFVILTPVLFATFLSIFESGWLMTRYMMLDRGVDMAVRDIRLGTDPNIDHDGLKASICDFSRVFKDCEANMIVELVPLTVGSAYPQNEANCYDRTEEITPVISFDQGGREEFMFVRACMVIDPIFPGIGLGLQLSKDASGGFQMISYSAFMNEPG